MAVSLLPAVADPAVGRGWAQTVPRVSPNLDGSVILGELWGKLQWQTHALITFIFPSVSLIGKKGSQKEKEAGEGDKAVD